MKTTDPSAVGRMLRGPAAHGWALAAGTGPATGPWRLVKDGRALHASSNRHWFCLGLPAGEDLGPPAYGALLRHSLDGLLCKWALDGEDVVLQAELPLEDADRCACELAIESIDAGAARQNASGALTGSASGRTPEPVLSQQMLALCLTVVEADRWFVKNKTTELVHFLYLGADRKFDAYLSIVPGWACWQIPLLADEGLKASLVPANRVVLWEHLLRLNRVLYWARFGIDPDGQVVLALDLPLEMLGVRAFRTAARTMAEYADAYAYDVQVLAELDADANLRGWVSRMRGPESIAGS